jgi:hypothetical protein
MPHMLTREGAAETGSKAKFSILRAWQRDVCSEADRLRSSSSAWGLSSSWTAGLDLLIDAAEADRLGRFLGHGGWWRAMRRKLLWRRY